MTHAGWLYKVLIDKHVTGPALPGQIQLNEVWGTPDDRLCFSADEPTGPWVWWKSPVYDQLALDAAVCTERLMCVNAALAKKVSRETGTPEDLAYNQACEDISEAIRIIQ